MYRLQIVLQPQNATQDAHRQHDRGRARVNRPHHEIRTENAAVPTRPQCHREDPRDHCVDGNRERNNSDGHRGNGFFEQVPFAGRTGPPQREQSIDPPSKPPMAGSPATIARSGNQWQVEVNQAPGQISAYREHVPDDRGLDSRRYRNRFSARSGRPRSMSTIDPPMHSATTVMPSAMRVMGRRQPGVGHAEDRGDQRSGMADADEEDEIGDVEPPRDLVAHAGHDQTAPPLDAVGEHPPDDYRASSRPRYESRGRTSSSDCMRLVSRSVISSPNDIPRHSSAIAWLLPVSRASPWATDTCG